MRRLGRRERQSILRRDGAVCRYCGAPATTVDHIIPVSRGGGNNADNLVAACTTCNQRKADKMPLILSAGLCGRPVYPSRTSVLEAGGEPLFCRRCPGWHRQSGGDYVPVRGRHG